MPLIEQQKALYAIEKCHKRCCRMDSNGDEWIHYETALNELEAIPTVQPKQPKRGKWIPYSQFYPEVNTHWIKWECSECGYARTKGWEGTTDGRCPTATICENCGADMRTKEADCDYERAVEQLEHDMLYEPTFNPDDGSM